MPESVTYIQHEAKLYGLQRYLQIAELALARVVRAISSTDKRRVNVEI